MSGDFWLGLAGALIVLLVLGTMVTMARDHADLMETYAAEHYAGGKIPDVV